MVRESCRLWDAQGAGNKRLSAEIAEWIPMGGVQIEKAARIGGKMKLENLLTGCGYSLPRMGAVDPSEPMEGSW